MLLSGAAQAEKNSITIGVTGGPHAQIMEEVKKVAAKDGLEIKVIEFSDYVQPNVALASGDLDANSYQHLPYLEVQVKDRGYKLSSIVPTVIYPMGLYSKKIDKLEDVKDSARVAIPNDPTNGGRALLLMETAGLLKLRDGAGLTATPLDIVENPKKLDLAELDAAQLPRSLDDVDLAAVNTNFAMEAGLVPKDDALLLESPDSPYANIIVVRTEDKDQEWVKRLVKAYHSDDVKQYIEEQFKGSIVTAW
ncbi:MetQ/NlpA family ABC transporter substrate-binding protein [Paenalcaligenes niemegkensis]|nr:MetQ/NlpA family ABC transporter substrate-binding protein [Paenalcaligenes niemegkensis]MCQ9617871.1 MetQ/NlpA family ABC transporter substrate-binding protein [Paenalcaligenes niemegkensis]